MFFPMQLKHVLAGDKILKLINCEKIEAIQEVSFCYKMPGPVDDFHQKAKRKVQLEA